MNKGFDLETEMTEMYQRHQEELNHILDKHHKQQQFLIEMWILEMQRMIKGE